MPTLGNVEQLINEYAEKLVILINNGMAINDHVGSFNLNQLMAQDESAPVQPPNYAELTPEEQSAIDAQILAHRNRWKAVQAKVSAFRSVRHVLVGDTPALEATKVNALLPVYLTDLSGVWPLRIRKNL